MSLKVIKAGLLDTLQDLGRYGFQHQGINPGGAMDQFSAVLANALLGKELKAPAVEMHFPAATVLFQKKAVVCLAGADFSPLVNGEEISLHQPVALMENSVLSFRKKKSGARCYLSLLNDWEIEPWLNSYSTNLKASVGGYRGRRLEKEDEMPIASIDFALEKNPAPLPWRYRSESSVSNEIEFTVGPEWNWLGTKSQTFFLNNAFAVSPFSDRMGYRLQGEALTQENKGSLLSSAVNFGTVQLLPNGQLIVLMADHQTTGGYPRVANVAKAHLPKLAQVNAGDEIRFKLVTIEEAEENFVAQQTYLHNLQDSCGSKMQKWLDAHRP